jgi:hypothetical protein
MMETDDELLRKFFADNKHEIADNGFSRRVMRRLPARRTRLLWHVWSAFCCTLALLLFVWLDGAKLVWNTLSSSVLESIAADASRLNPTSVMIAVGVLLLLGVRKLATLE